MADVIIVGGGLAGLCCARELHRTAISFSLFEASDDVGGRARTDICDDYRLDLGFQVLLTSYPEAQRVLDYPSLQLGRFQPGALIRYEGEFRRFVDPWRQPKHLLTTLTSPLATLGDKLRVARLRRKVCRLSPEQLALEPEVTTRDALAAAGFSEKIVKRFFEPFLGGVFLERDLETSSRLFQFVMRMFSTGAATLPAHGMGAIAQQLARVLPGETVRTNTAVERVQNRSVTLQDGQTISAQVVVMATPAPVTAQLLGDDLIPSGHGVTCLYFAADRPPVDEPILLLNGEGTGPIQNACVPSQVAPSYAPAGKALISVSVLDPAPIDRELESSVRDQLQDWFGRDVTDWELLKTYRIPFALPVQTPPALTPVAKPVRRSDSLFVCGDHMDTASIHGAMLSGRRAAEQVRALLGTES